MSEHPPAWSDLLAGLGQWLPRQRWFAGKGRDVSGYEVAADVPLRTGDDAELWHLGVDVDYADGPSERYQLLLGLRSELPQRLEFAMIGQLGDLVGYDATHDAELMGELLDAIQAERRVDGLRFRRLPGAEIETGLHSRHLTGEQSNTSVVYTDTYILKLFRRVAAGVNPDLEITRALALAGSPHVAPPLGWLEGSIAGEPATFALLQPFLVSATDGWALATTSVRDLYAEGDLHADEVGGDFAGEAERLGAATAEVHTLLRAVLPTSTADQGHLAELARQMRARLDAAVKVVPELAPSAPALQAAYDELAGFDRPVLLQRIHGDYHLGQVLRTDTGWVLLDFEGEPAKPLAERLMPDSALRDVAGMMRSIDYAARFLLAERPGNPSLEYRAGEWAARNRDAFCAGYAAAAGADPRDDGPLLRAYELDKAVYEVVYEARHRPSWLPIPLGSIERLVASPRGAA